MAAFEAVGYAKFSGRVGVCVATSGPGAIHLLNGLYDAMLDHVPVVAIVGQTSRSAMGGSYQQEVDLITLFKDVCHHYVETVTVPEQLPNLIDRAIRIATSHPRPTCIIIPSDVQELAYEPPGHAFKMVPSSLGIEWPTPVAGRRGHPPGRRDPQRRRRRSPSWSARGRGAPGRGDRGGRPSRRRSGQGAARQRRARRRSPLRDRRHRAAGDPAELRMMMDCDTLLTVGSNFPYTQFMPPLDQARAIQIDLDGVIHRHALSLRAQPGRRRRVPP